MREDREERTRELPLGPGFVAGDVVGIEMGTLLHRAGVREVLAVFGTDGGERHASPEITLRGLPRGTRPGRRRSSEVSRVTLSAVVPSDVPPGEYRCRRLEAETHAGRRTPLGPATGAAWRGWRFRVR